MQAPGSYPGSSPSQPRNSTLKILLVVLVFVGVPCILGSFFLLQLGRTGVRMIVEGTLPTVSCAYSFEQAREAMRQYAKANGGKLPPAETWEDAIRPYYAELIKGTPKGGKVLNEELKLTPFPAEGPWGCAVDGRVVTGVAFNRDLAGQILADVAKPAQTVLLFEVPKPGKNLSEPYTTPPKEAAPKFMQQPRDWLRLFVVGEGPFSDGTFRPQSPMAPTPPDAPEAPSGPSTGTPEAATGS